MALSHKGEQTVDHPQNTMIITVFFCMLTTIVLWLPSSLYASSFSSSTNLALVILYSIIFGFASGSNISLTPVCVGQLCDTEDYGRYYATCYTIVSFGTLVGIPIAGALINVTGGNYWGTITYTGCSYAAALLCLIGVRGMKVGWGLREVF